MTYIEIAKKLYDKCPQRLMDITEEAFTALESLDRRRYDEIMKELETECFRIEPEEAEEIVRKMSPRGQMWTMDQVQDVMHQHGETGDLVDWYLVMNMTYNDYYNTARNYGMQDDVEFYYRLSKDFLEDQDAKPFKVAKYFAK